MPGADFSTWTPLAEVAGTLERWVIPSVIPWVISWVIPWVIPWVTPFHFYIFFYVPMIYFIVC